MIEFKNFKYGNGVVKGQINGMFIRMSSVVGDM